MKAGFLRASLVLGLLQAIGPFAIDMYLPALPSIGQSLGADIDAVQLSLMVFFIALGLGQLLYGPISDMVGRKPPLYFGLGLFAVAGAGGHRHDGHRPQRDPAGPHAGGQRTVQCTEGLSQAAR